MYAVPGCWAGLLGADCDYSPNPLNGTLQHKVVFVITFFDCGILSEAAFLKNVLHV